MNNRASFLLMGRLMQRLLSDLLEFSPIGIAVLDSDLRYEYINQVLADSNGATAAGHIGLRPSDVLPDIGAGLETVMRKVMDSGQAECDFEASAEIPPGSGRTTWWRASYHPRRNVQGEICGIVAMVEDITLRRHAEQAIRESGERVRRVLDTLFTFVGVLDTDGVLQEANRAPLEQGGIDLADVQGKPFWECYWWSHDPLVQAELRAAVARAAQGETVRYDVTVRMKQDSRMIIDFMLKPLRDEDGRIGNLIASGIDITERKRNEEALQVSETYFRQVVESTPDGLMIVDEDGVIRLINSRMEQMFASTREALVGQSVSMLLPEESRPQHAGLVSGFFREPAARDMANRRPLFALRRDGTRFPCEIGLNPMRVGPERELLTLACVTDVSERYQSRQMLEKALQEKTVLLGEVHHRVKNNLQVISSLLNLQARNTTLEVHQALLDSQNHVRSMALIHQLLYERNDFSRIPVSVYVERLLHLLRDVGAGYNSRLRLSFRRDGDEAYLDLQASIPFGLILNELVVNACKHAFGPGEAGEVEIVMRFDDALAITVRDAGRGLPPGVELGASSTLGFQLLPMLAEQLRGELSVESAPGQGCRFVLRVPECSRE